MEFFGFNKRERLSVWSSLIILTKMTLQAELLHPIRCKSAYDICARLSR